MILVLQNEARAALILKCPDGGLYPSWDAQNRNSVRPDEKLGYEFDHEYAAYEVAAGADTQETKLARRSRSGFRAWAEKRKD